MKGQAHELGMFISPEHPAPSRLRESILVDLLLPRVLMGLIRGHAEDATRLVLTGVLVGFLFDALTQLITTAFGDADATRFALFRLLTAATVSAVGAFSH